MFVSVTPKGSRQKTYKFIDFSLLIISSVKETADNPFVTTLEQVPVQEVHFPAVSVATSAEDTPPWERLLDYVLSNSHFDCFNHTSCDGAEVMRGDLGETFRVSVEPVFMNFFQGFQALMQFEPSVATFFRDAPSIQRMCRIFDGLLPGVNPLLEGLATGLEASSLQSSLHTIMMDFLVENFRLPKHAILGKLRDMVAQYQNVTADNSIDAPTCFDARNHEDVTSAAIFALMFGLGSEGPRILLPHLVKDKNRYNQPFVRDYFKEKWNDMLVKSFEQLEPGSPLSYSDIYYLTSPWSKTEVYGYYEIPSNLVQNVTGCDSRTLTPKEDVKRTFCQEPPLSTECCTAQTLLGTHYDKVLRAMKYSVLPSTWDIGEVGKADDIKAGIKRLNYSPVSSSSFRTSLRPAIIAHEYVSNRGTGTWQKQPSFQYSFSDRGICSTFNGLPYPSMFKNNIPMNTFYQEIIEKPSDQSPGDPVLIAMNGIHSGLLAVVYVPSTRAGEGTRVAIHDPFVLPDFQGEPITVYSKNTYTITVTPSLSSIDEQVDELPPTEKNCMSGSDDHNLTLFRTYSYASCTYECHLKHATTDCNCIPWDLPRWTEDLPVCHYPGSSCVKERMENPGGIEPVTCSCAKDCERRDYAYHVTTSKTNNPDLCGRKILSVSPPRWETMERSPLNDFAKYLSISGPSMLHLAMGELDPDSEITREINECTDYLNNAAVIRVFIGPPVANVNRRSLRVTLTDQLINFGKKNLVLLNCSVSFLWGKN